MGNGSKRTGIAVLVTFIVTFSVRSFFFPDLVVTGVGAAHSVLSLCSITAVLLVLAWASYKHGVKLLVLQGGLIVCTLAAWALQCVPESAPDGPFGMLSYAALGAAGAFSLVLTGCALTCLGSRLARGVVVVGFALAAVLTLLDKLMPAVPLFTREVSIVLFIAFALVFYARHASDLSFDFALPVTLPLGSKRLSPAELILEAGNSTAITYLASVLYALVFGLLEFYLLMGTSAGEGFMPWVVVCAVCAASLVAVAANDARHAFNGLFLVVCILSIVAMPVVLIFPEHLGALLAVVMAAFTFMFIPVWVCLVEISDRRDISPTFLFALFPAAFSLMHVVGRAISWALVVLGGFDGDSAALFIAILVATIAVAAIAILAFLLAKGASLRPSNQPASGVPVEGAAAITGWDHAFAELCDKYNLSEREADIVRLYAQGRSVPFISAQLSIAKSTAKTHIGNVYSKMGIHTKQELINALGEPTPTDK